MWNRAAGSREPRAYPVAMKPALAFITLLLAFGCERPAAPPTDPVLAPAVNRELVLDAARVRYLDAGPSEGPVVLLLHGGRYRGATWLEIDTPRVLAERGFRTIAPDLPGYGDSLESPIPREDFLARFLDALSIESCVVVTPSMSGAFALPFAARAPERVTGLVALAPVSIEEWVRELEPTTRALLVWGSEDATVPPADAEPLLERLKRARLEVLEGAGHPAYLEQPARFHELLLAFLAEEG